MMPGEDQSKPGPEDAEKKIFETKEFSFSTNIVQPDRNDMTIRSNRTEIVDSDGLASDQADTARAADTSVEGFPSDIPGFTVERELGRGAFGVVYAAQDEMLQRKVAIKKPLISDPRHRQQYIDEARKAVKLEHPGIVPIYHVGTTTGGEPFVVQKLIEGTSLRGLLRNYNGRLPMVQIISIMRQICMAVDAAHAAGIVHRDLKPENLLVEPDGRAYVADFGLAILEDEEPLKKGREVAGTPFYMSPEQFTGRNEWLDGRSDIWALGVIFYELLSGKTPFAGKTISELKDEIRNKDPRPIHQRDPNIPPAFDALFRKCCAKQTSDRYSSVREMIVELDAICKTLMLDPVQLEAFSKIGMESGLLSRSGSIFETSRDTLTARGISTNRNLATTVRQPTGSSIFQEHRVFWAFAGPVLTTILTLAALVSGAWYMKLGPFATVEHAAVPNSIPETKPTVESNSSTGSLSIVALSVPEKPFFVSIKGDGTHDSIAKAIADSAAGETITIRAGTYRGSFIVDRSLKIVGEGEVLCLATNKGCMEVRADCTVDVENVNFDCQTDEHNAIDLFGGRLNLKDCQVHSSSRHTYDCVRARSNSVLVADRCDFQSMEHPAIYADPDSTIAIQDSTISFPGNLDYGTKRCGIQATGANGLVRGCVIKGPCIVGVDWMDSPLQELTIERCRFENCDVGIQTKNCGKVRIQGTSEEPCEIKNTRRAGIHFVGSVVDLLHTNVVGNDESSKIGLQIAKNSNVKCLNCSFEGMQCGVLADQSELFADGLTVRKSKFAGMIVNESKVNAGALRLLDGADFGLVVLSTTPQFRVKSLEIDAAKSKERKLTLAIYATSGEIHFDNAVIQNCLYAIFVDPDREAIKESLPPTKSVWADLIQASKRPDQPLPLISGDSMAITDCDGAWMFLGTGTSKIKKISGNLGKDGLVPKLFYPEKFEVNGTDYSDFAILPKSPGKRK